MGRFVLRLIVNAIAILVTAYLLPGITITDTGFVPMLILAVVIAIVNAFVKPILMILSCPFVIITLGLFILVVNGLALALVGAVVEDLVIDSFGWAILGGFVMAIISAILETLLGLDEEEELED